MAASAITAAANSRKYIVAMMFHSLRDFARWQKHPPIP